MLKSLEKKNSAVALAACLFLTAAAGAAENASPLTWQDCVARAAQKNPDILSSQKTWEASRAQYRGSYNAVLPTLNLTNSYSESSAAGGASITTWQLSGNARWSVFDLSNIASIRGASARLGQAGAAQRVQSSNVLLSLYQTFAGLLYAQEQIHVADDIRDIWQRDAALIGLRYDSGRESKGNKMRTDAQLLQAESDVSQARRDLRVAQQNLSQALGEDQFQALAVTGTWTRAALPEALPDFDNLARATPRIQNQEAILRESRANLQSARSDILPNLSLNYSRGTFGQAELPKDNDTWTLGAQLNLPIFAGGPTATYYNVSAAKRSVESAEARLRSLRNQVRSDLEGAWSDLAQAQDQVRVQEAFLAAARQRRSESDIRYENGLMSFEDWQLAVADLTNFEKSYLRSQESRLLAEAQWRFVQGEQLGDRP